MYLAFNSGPQSYQKRKVSKKAERIPSQEQRIASPQASSDAHQMADPPIMKRTTQPLMLLLPGASRRPSHSGGSFTMYESV